MGNIHFRLNRGVAVKEPKKPHAIFLRYQIGGKIDFMASTKIKAIHSDWKEETERLKHSGTKPAHLAANEHLDKLESYFKEFDNENLRKGIIPSYQEVKEHFKRFWKDNSTKKEESVTLLKFIDNFIKNAKDNNTVSPGTLKSYKLAKTFLEEYHKRVEPLMFESIDIEWYHRFVKYCREKGYTENYIGKNIKFLKLVLRKAFEKNHSNNQVFNHSEFKVLRENVENIYLNLDELKKMWELDLSAFPEHEKVRDIFLIGCYTGLRISDFSQVKKENILNSNGKEILKITPTKTKKPIAIPLNPVVREILNKYNYEPPRNLYEQKINKLIKDVGEWAGIDNHVFYFVTKGGKKVKNSKLKFELIKTHTARRSFCSNAFNAEIPIIDIMTISGHTSERTFLNYIKTPPEEKVQRISEHPFFN